MKFKDTIPIIVLFILLAAIIFTALYVIDKELEYPCKNIDCALDYTNSCCFPSYDNLTFSFHPSSRLPPLMVLTTIGVIGITLIIIYLYIKYGGKETPKNA